MKRAIVLWLDDIFNATVLVLEIENLTRYCKTYTESEYAELGFKP